MIDILERMEIKVRELQEEIQLLKNKLNNDNSIEDFLYYNGEKYILSDEIAHEGDIIIYPKVHEDWGINIDANKPYLVYSEDGLSKFKNNGFYTTRVYGVDEGYDDIRSVKVFVKSK